MFYREAGDFSASYEEDSQTFPIKFDRYRYYLVLFLAVRQRTGSPTCWR